MLHSRHLSTFGRMLLRVEQKVPGGSEPALEMTKEETAVKARRVTEITLQTDEAFVLRRRAGSAHAHCPGCGSVVPMFTPEEATALLRVSVRTIYREIEAGQLHFHETPEGSVLVCLDSLQKITSLLTRNSNSQIKTNTNTNTNKEI